MTRKELEEKFDKCLDLIDKCNKDRQECDPDMDRRIQAYATVALACAVRMLCLESGGGEPKKPIEIGDTKIVFCKKCEEKTEHILINRKAVGRAWKCTKCDNLISLGVSLEW